MKLNSKKTNIMIFNKSRKLDFQPTVYINGDLLDVVEHSKLLGVMISTDLKWAENIKYIVTRSMCKLWMLRRIKELGGSREDLLLVYILQIRCITELACPAWNGALTIKDSIRLENIQRCALKIILGTIYQLRGSSHCT